MSTFQAEIESYLAAQRVHRQPRGVRAYGYALRALAAHAGGSELSPEVVADWFVSRAGLAPATVLADMAAVGSFGRWRQLRDPGAADLLRLVERPRRRRGDTIRAPSAQIVAVARWCEGDDATPRSARIVALCLYAGLRREEARLLDWSSVDEAAMELVVRAETAKGRKGRRVPVGPPLARLLAAVPRSAREGAVAGQHDGRPLSVGGVAHIFDRELPRFNIRLSPHMLRRAFATRLDELGVSARVIQELLGHSSLETTQRYIGVERRRMALAVELLESAFDA